ncbi:MAG: sigma-54 dependent transcriptional regulator [Deferrisomatales bacterium]
MTKRLLVVDDEEIVRRGFQRIFSGTEIQVETCPSGRLALRALQERPFDLVLTDLKMPGMDGIEVLRAIKVLQPDVPVMLITGYSTVDTAVAAMKEGAYDYLAKPFTREQIVAKVREALARAPKPVEAPPVESFGEIIGTCPEMQAVYRRIQQVAPTDSTVLITGESGTGKELVARAVHDRSRRRDGPFVPVDCTALAETLLESELFGHVKGAFTGAVRAKTGLFQVADGGTLFLDEVANIGLAVQAKLLRALQERRVTPIGDTRSVPVDIRVVAATNRDLQELVEAGRFREDLYFRLNIIPIRLPPLRERRQDLGMLVAHFVRKYADQVGKTVRGCAPDALHVLQTYSFPGNVRELENVLERAVVVCRGEWIGAEDLELHGPEQPPWEDDGVPRTADELKAMKKTARAEAAERLERAFVLAALRRNGWNVTRAAADTGMLRPNFHALLKKLRISLKDGEIPQ